jgi:hypothetical protein
MNKTFAALKIEAETAKDMVSLYRAVNAANTKLYRNIKKAQFLSYTQGAAADADHYFQNVIPAWQIITNEINAIWTAKASKLSAEKIVEIIMAAR